MKGFEVLPHQGFHVQKQAGQRKRFKYVNRSFCFGSCELPHSSSTDAFGMAGTKGDGSSASVCMFVCVLKM